MIQKRVKRAKRIKMINPENTPRIDPLKIPWQEVDVISSNCPKHVGVRLSRLDDETFQCPLGKEVYLPHGSVTNQTTRDNYYLGLILK